jgi:hypothetical protein
MMPFITFRDKDAKGDLQYYILQRAFPNFVGRITRTPVDGALINQPISGYDLYVTFAGTIQGNIVPDYRNIQQEIQNVYIKMAAWFWTERIIMDDKKFKKFKIKTDDKVPTE